MKSEKKRSLRIGYIWQYETADKYLADVTATALHMSSLINALKIRGHQVRIISYFNQQPHWSDDGETWQEIPTLRRKFLSRIFESIVRGVQSRLKLPYFNLFESYRFSEACVAVAVDVDVFYERFWLLASGGLIASKRLGIPIVYEVNGDIVEEYHLMGNSLPDLHWSAIHFVTKQMFKFAGKVVAVNDILMNRLVSRYRLQLDKVCVIDNGAHVDNFSRVEKESLDWLVSKYELIGKVSIIFVGTFKPWHGIDLLVNAFDALSKTNLELKLILVGDGPLMSVIRQDIKEKGLDEKVVFTGMVEPNKVPDFLNIADIAVLNPRVSGASAAQSPLKLFEYMAAGKAIVAPQTNYVKKILTDREDALLVIPDDLESLKGSLLELIENKQLRNHLGKSAQQKALQEHSWEKVAERIEDIMYTLGKDPSTS